VTPFTLPWLFRKMGPVKLDFFFGKLSGNEFPPRPLIHGEKISFKPTRNLEFGFSRTAEFGGVGRPMTLGAIWHSYTSYVSSVNYGPSGNPGKRTGALSFVQSPLCAQLANDLRGFPIAGRSFTHCCTPARGRESWFLHAADPRSAQDGSSIRGGLHNTPTRNPSNFGGQYIYWELFYHDLYTNKKNIIGNWIGRDGQGFQSWSKYWFSPRNTLEFGYRHASVDSNFIPGGETVNDGSIKLDWWVRRDLSVSTFVQYEKWKAPLLAPTPQTNWTSTVAIAFWPRRGANRFMERNTSMNETETAKGAQPGNGPEGNGTGVSLEGTTESGFPRPAQLLTSDFFGDIAGYCCAPFSSP